ncbi:MAG: hypothetical protein KJP21_00680 [Bacteroidia bacterium]|nr:hypothetical protein [Bacteroidia bacterium]NNJ56501.1 hypothetical protein [Bacteroidia bacterium]
MDNLQHIDDLLKKSAPSFEYAEVGANDWLAIEKKLKQRKKRIYALWFFLALVFVSSSILLINNTSSDKVQPLSVNEAITNEVDKTVNNAGKEDQAIKNDINASIDKDKELGSIQLKGDITINETAVTPITPLIITVSENEVQSLNTIPDEQSGLIANSKSTNSPIEIENAIEKADNIVPHKITDKDEDAAIAESEKPSVVLNNSDLPKSNNQGDGNNSKLDKNTSGYWELGFSFTPSISNKRITENSLLAGLIHVNYYDKAASSENSSFSNSAGINAQYHLPNGIFVTTGAFISQRTEAVNYDYSIDSVPINNNNEIVGYKPQAPVPVKYSGSNSYHFMEIPLNIGYKTPISTKFEIRSQVGMSYLFLFNQKGKKADFNDLSLKDVTNFALNKNNVAANAKVGMYYNGKHFTIGAEPTFSLNLNNLNVKESSAIIVKPYSYGFNISTNYKFIK